MTSDLSLVWTLERTALRIKRTRKYYDNFLEKNGLLAIYCIWQNLIFLKIRMYLA